MKGLAVAGDSFAFSEALREVGCQWAASEQRPRVAREVRLRWDVLIDDWAAPELPLIVRKGGGVRGSELVHASGRRIIVADNSAAQWAFMRAYRTCSQTAGVARVLARCPGADAGARNGP